MTKHESPFFQLPDFDELIAIAENLRQSIEADYEGYFQRLLPVLGQQVEKDVRLSVFAHLGGLLDSTLLAFTFINRQLLPLDNAWWDNVYKPPFRPFDAYARSVNINRLNNAFIKSAFLIELFSEIESTFRILLRRIDPGVCNGATTSFCSVYRALKKRIGSFPADSDELTDLLRLSRNTLHNNGVYFDERGHNRQVSYNSGTYNFVHGKPIDFVNWHWLFERFEDVRRLCTTVISNPRIIELPDFIGDPFAIHRKTVPK
jgi:hypothetical protein